MAARSLLCRCLTLILLLLLAGCGGSKPAELAAVTGKVNYRGRPLASGTIVFVPDPERGTSGELARGTIQQDGSYRLKTGEAPGIVSGWHRVTVTCVDAGTPPPGSLTVPRSLLPAKYQDPQLSGLSCEVKAGKENTINFNLE